MKAEDMLSRSREPVTAAICSVTGVEIILGLADPCDDTPVELCPVYSISGLLDATQEGPSQRKPVDAQDFVNIQKLESHNLVFHHHLRIAYLSGTSKMPKPNHKTSMTLRLSFIAGCRKTPRPTTYTASWQIEHTAVSNLVDGKDVGAQ